MVLSSNIKVMDLSKVVNKITGKVAFIVVSNKAQSSISTGSGFVIDDGGIIVTCAHVVEMLNRTIVMVKFPGKDFMNAEVLLTDDEHDLCLVKCKDASNIKPMSVASDSGKIKVGNQVMFSGYPFSDQNLTTHQGIISAIIEDQSGMINYKLDASINSGNSGGPLMNVKGEVIGIINTTARQKKETIDKVKKMTTGALSLHGVDLVEMYQAMADNLQLGIGYAVPSYYIPNHKKKPKARVKK